MSELMHDIRNASATYFFYPQQYLRKTLKIPCTLRELPIKSFKNRIQNTPLSGLGEEDSLLTYTSISKVKS